MALPDLNQETEDAFSVIYSMQFLQSVIKATQSQTVGHYNAYEYAYVLDDFISKLTNHLEQINKVVSK